jgi:hypothetical protein
MHSNSKAQLEQLKNLAMQFSAGPARRTAFLNGLGPIHVVWHTTPVSHGFLIFHWEVIKHFKAVGGPAQFGGVTAFTTTQLTNFGAAYNVNVTMGRGDIAALRAFSSAIQSWHNGAHMRIQAATGLNMMDAGTNIYLREFWRLHYFINAKFESKLRSYRQVSTQSIPTVIANIESNNHSLVSRI